MPDWVYVGLPDVATREDILRETFGIATVHSCAFVNDSLPPVWCTDAALEQNGITPDDDWLQAAAYQTEGFNITDLERLCHQVR
jgi:hypothetical protein